VLGVVFNDTIEAAQAFDTKWGTRQFYPSIADPNGTFAFRYGVTSPPSTFVIDTRGRVVAELLGPVSTAQLNNVIARVRA
jgi:cytochrome c biogenesis protein CcmG/thiol:disulfide interchange protein DsbE